MMKTLLWVSCLTVAAAATSCTKKNYYTTPSTTIIAQADSTSWKVDQSGDAWTISISMPEITNSVNLTDNVSVAISYNYNTSSSSDIQFEAIPELYNGYSYSYVYGVGYLSIYAQSPSGTVPAATPGAVWVKVVLTPSNQE
ncbi:hypothetical protein [Dinghuibacter silviterrae]|uniref:Lipoprotein n=1 Tax=Dinghuibacter silviterrae TaxID=1539049 RepID=A0A4R8DJ64_9BACT|nr:hypothetical protein [Dinghuibacter silviterrae]TDW97226.1 hypothetical protein EDB95_5072 [Dinghuibacter silviterrae]